MAEVPAECVIGVDLGGTKAIAGAVDATLAVHYRARREVPTSDLAALLETLTELVEEVREAVGERSRASASAFPA